MKAHKASSAVFFSRPLELLMFDDLPAPFMVEAIKVWPVHSRPGFAWFIAHEGKPYYFKTKPEAILFAKDAQSGSDPEGLCD